MDNLENRQNYFPLLRTISRYTLGEYLQTVDFKSISINDFAKTVQAAIQVPLLLVSNRTDIGDVTCWLLGDTHQSTTKKVNSQIIRILCPGSPLIYEEFDPQQHPFDHHCMLDSTIIPPSSTQRGWDARPKDAPLSDIFGQFDFVFKRSFKFLEIVDGSQSGLERNEKMEQWVISFCNFLEEKNLQDILNQTFLFSDEYFLRKENLPYLDRYLQLKQEVCGRSMECSTESILASQSRR